VVESLKHSSRTVGLKQSVKVVENGTAQTLFIARDAEERVISGIRELAVKKGINVEYIDTMKLLGKACGIEVGAAVACAIK
jgi:large subunit ribosomal protein L7A